MRAETPCNTLGKVKIDAVADNVPDWPTESKPETLSVYWSIRRPRHWLANDLAEALREEKADTLNKTVCYIEARTLVGALAITLTKDVGRDKKPTLANWMADEQVEAFSYTVKKKQA